MDNKSPERHSSKVSTRLNIDFVVSFPSCASLQLNINNSKGKTNI